VAVMSEPEHFGPPANIVLDHVSKHISASLIGYCDLDGGLGPVVTPHNSEGFDQQPEDAR
jgi:hypothetical protein